MLNKSSIVFIVLTTNLKKAIKTSNYYSKLVKKGDIIIDSIGNKNLN